MLKVEEMTQKEINQEIKRLDLQLTKILLFAVVFILGFIVELVLIILGVVPFDLISIGVLSILPLGLIQNIKHGRDINLQLFLLNMFKIDEDGE